MTRIRRMNELQHSIVLVARKWALENRLNEGLQAIRIYEIIRRAPCLPSQAGHWRFEINEDRLRFSEKIKV